MAENQVYLIKSGSNSFVEETEAVVGISGGKVGIGTTHPEADLHVTGSVKVGGDLTVDGAFTTINSNTISVDDKNIELGSTENPTDATADGGGITVKGATDKTFNWLDATDAWTSSEHLYLADGKHFSADELRALDSDGLKLADATTSGVLIKGGKVGIHKATPVYDLDVDGSGNFASLYVGGNAVLTGEGSIFGKWEDGATPGEIFYTGGNVGVGTNNPEYPLHVFGNAAVDGNFIVNGTSGNLNVSNFNVSGDSIVLNYLGDTLASSRGGLIVKDSSNVSKSFEYVEGSDFWNSNVGLNITNGGLNVASVSAVDVNGLTLGDDAGNGIFVEDGGQIGINTTSPNYNLHVNGSTHVGGEFSVGSEFKISAGGAVGGTAPASDGDIIKWDDANNKWIAGANVGGGGGGGVGEVPLATINSLPSGQSIYEIEFAETYNVEPRIATQLEIDGEGSIIPYVVSGVSTSGYHLIFAQDIPNNNYRIHTTFGGRDVHWETGAGASLYYNDGDVSIQRNFTIGGNLTVNGTTTTVNTETVEIEDHNLVIAANTGYNQLDSQYPAGGAYAGVLWGTGDAGAASPVRLTYQTNKGFAFEGGNVGIGTTNPRARVDIIGKQPYLESASNLVTAVTKSALAVQGASDAGAGLFVGVETSDALVYLQGSNGNGSAQVDLLLQPFGGNVGIGTTNPDGNLHIHSGTAGTITAASAANDLVIENSDAAGLSILFDDTANNAYGSIYFGNETDGNSDGRINYFGSTYSNANDRQAMVFRTASTEAMRITSDGNVGIGTTNPNTGISTDVTMLQIEDNNLPLLKLTHQVGGSLEIYKTGAGDTMFGHNEVTKLTISSGGNVGIGTTNPGGSLHVNYWKQASGTVTVSPGTNEVTGTNTLFNSDFVLYNTIKISGEVFWISGIQSNTSLTLSANHTTGAIDSAVYKANRGLLVGNVTEGFSNSTHLGSIVVDFNGLSNIALTNSKNDAYTYISHNGDSFKIQNSFGTSAGRTPISLSASGEDDIFIKNNGNVGIGTTNPSKQLHIEDINANSPGLKISASDLDYEHEVRAQGDGLLISADSTNYGGVGPNIRFNVSDSERMRINKKGNVGIGTTDPGGKLHVYNDLSVPIGDVVLTDDGGDPPVVSTEITGTDLNTKISNGDRIKINGEIFTVSNVQPTTLTLSGTPSTADTYPAYTDGEGLIVTSAGNVGIGTTDPIVKLHIKDNSSTTSITSANSRSIIIQDTSEVDNALSALTFTTSNLYGSALIGTRATTNVSGAGVRSDIIFVNRNSDNGFTEKMVIKSGGNVGIGTTDPRAPLEVDTTKTYDTEVPPNVTAVSGGIIVPRIPSSERALISSPTDGEIIYNTTDNRFEFRQNGQWVYYTATAV